MKVTGVTTSRMHLRCIRPPVTWTFYVLASYGQGRLHQQIFNKLDPCCYAGTGWRSYSDVVSSRVRELGAGEVSVLMDETHPEHSISEQTATLILQAAASNQIS